MWAFSYHQRLTGENALFLSDVRLRIERLRARLRAGGGGNTGEEAPGACTRAAAIRAERVKATKGE